MNALGFGEPKPFRVLAYILMSSRKRPYLAQETQFIDFVSVLNNTLSQPSIDSNLSSLHIPCSVQAVN